MAINGPVDPQGADAIPSVSGDAGNCVNRYAETAQNWSKGLAARLSEHNCLDAPMENERCPMRPFILLLLATVGLGGMTLQAGAACNARGEFCSYPGWASNAFAPDDRTPGPEFWTDSVGYSDDAPWSRSALGYVAPGPARSMAASETERRYRRLNPR